MKKALVGDGDRVCQVVSVGEEFQVCAPLFWIDCSDEVNPLDYMFNGVSVVLMPPPSTQELLDMCKSIAKGRLIYTDYVELPTVAASLLNYADFIVYRNAVRALYIAPVEEPEWPIKPDALWA